MTTAAGEMRELLTELKVPAKKADAIMERFGQLLSDVSAPGMVHVNGSHVAIEYVEAYGLEIGLDACGNASTVANIGVGWPQGLDVGELEYAA